MSLILIFHDERITLIHVKQAVIILCDANLKKTRR